MKTAFQFLLSLLLTFTLPLTAYADLAVKGTPLGPPAPPPPPVSINPAALTGQASQQGGQGANNAAGAALIASAIPLLSQPPTMPMGMMLLAMGLLALAQGGHDGGAAGQSGTTAATSNALNGVTGTGATGDGSTTGSAPTPGLDGGMAGAFATPAGKQAVAAIEAAGGSVSPQGITMPDGSFKAWSSFGSEGAMRQAGMDPTDAMKVVKDIEKKMGGDSLPKTGTEFDSSGGGGSRSVASDESKPFVNPFALTADAKAKLIAGKTVNYKNDPIGVAMDDIFAMIHRAYVRKADADSFIVDNVAAAPTGRSPASLKDRK